MRIILIYKICKIIFMFSECISAYFGHLATGWHATAFKVFSKHFAAGSFLNAPVMTSQTERV